MSNDIVLGQIVALEQLNGLELRQRYTQIFGTDPPNSNKPWLKAEIAHRLQEMEYRRALSDKAKSQMSIALGDNGFNPSTGEPCRGKRTTDGRILQVALGTEVKREYRGRVYTITALAKGRWQYDGISYSSTSAIARLITGTNMSGPDFFGLNRNADGSRKSTTERRK